MTCRLTVAALEGADSGEIGCKIEQENIEVFKELTVFGKCSNVGTSNRAREHRSVQIADGVW